MKRLYLVPVLLTFLCFQGPLEAFADEIHMKDGSVLKGHIGAQGETTLYFVPGNEQENPRWISITEVESIKKDAVPEALLRKRKQEALQEKGAS